MNLLRLSKNDWEESKWDGTWDLKPWLRVNVKSDDLSLVKGEIHEAKEYGWTGCREGKYW